MKSYWQEIFGLLLILSVTLSAANDDLAIRDLCRLRVGNFPHPNPKQCHLYVACQLVNGVVRSCEEGNIFVNSEQCVAGDRTTCTRSDSVPTQSASSTQQAQAPTIETPNVDNFCQNVEFGIFEDPRSCTSLIICISGVPQFIDCPPQRPVFDISREACFEGNPVTCELFGPPTLPPPTVEIPTFPPPPPTIPPPPPTIPPPPPTIPPPPPTIPPPPPTFPPPPVTTVLPPPTPPIGTTTQPGPTQPPPPTGICRGRNFEFVANPSSCYQYYFCFLVVPISGECDSDRIFSESLQGCVLGNQQTCERNRNINIVVIPRMEV